MAARMHPDVIVTACVSPKERDIVKMLQQELLPVIEVMDNGFSDKYKPTCKAFYAVAEHWGAGRKGGCGRLSDKETVMMGKVKGR